MVNMSRKRTPPIQVSHLTDTFITRCQICGWKLVTIESRMRKFGETETIWRRKQCIRCGPEKGVIRTMEVPEAVGKEIFQDENEKE